jgi:hypothetical protein
MSQTQRIPQTIIWLQFDPPLGDKVMAKDLRGGIASRNGNDIFHQHIQGDKVAYRYPQIQYKRIPDENRACILGLGKGAQVVRELDLLEQVMTFHGLEHRVVEQQIVVSRQEFGPCDQDKDYTFSTPWLALNEKNYQQYMCTGLRMRQKALLERLLVGNILSLSKGIGLRVDQKIIPEVAWRKEVQTSLKGTPLLGFYAQFAVNFKIPDLWGLGKSVSRGFGSVQLCP